MSIESRIPTQGVLNHLDLAPKNLGRKARSAWPWIWYAQLLSWASNSPMADRTAPISTQSCSHFPAIIFAATAMNPDSHSLWSTDTAPVTANSGIMVDFGDGDEGHENEGREGDDAEGDGGPADDAQAEGRESGDVDDAAEELPGPHQRAYEGTEGPVGPDHEAAVAGECGGELGGDEGLRDAPDEWEDEEAEDGEKWAGGLDRRFLAVGSSGDLEVDEEDEWD
nr:Os03g0375933 [Ipomoea batatas]